MTKIHRRHDISDDVWQILEPHLSGKKGAWEHLLEILVKDPDYEWLMIDATHIKVHPHAAGAIGGNQDMTRSKDRPRNPIKKE